MRRAELDAQSYSWNTMLQYPSSSVQNQLRQETYPSGQSSAPRALPGFGYQLHYLDVSSCAEPRSELCNCAL